MIFYESIANTIGTFPNTTAKNASGGGATDGTPYIRAVVDDLWGFSQALMDAANLTPNAVTESATASQRLDALRRVLGYPGEVIAWMGAGDPQTVVPGMRLLALNGQGILRANYSELDAVVYVGNPLNPTAPAFYHADDAAGTIRNIAGVYLILPDLRGYFLRGLDVAETKDKDGASRIQGDSEVPALPKHRHQIMLTSTPPNGAPQGVCYSDSTADQPGTLNAVRWDVSSYTQGTGNLWADENDVYKLNNAVLREDDARPWNSATRWAIRY
jgi:hypothetical protein